MSFPYINAYQQFFDSSGSPLASGTIEFRNPTTNALIKSYPDADNADAQTNENANPLTLNASGAAASGLFLEDGVAYKVILKDAAGATVKSDDDVRCPQFDQPLQPGLHLRASAEEREGLANGHVEHVGDASAAIGHFEDLVAVTGAAALEIMDVGIGNAFTLQGAGLVIGIGAWMGTIMLFNVWVLIWPNQKKILGIVEASAEEIAKAKGVALMASRTNTFLSIPMLMCMVGQGHGLPL